MIGEGFVEKFIVYVVRERLWKINLLKCKLIKPSEEMRVAFSAMIRITDGSGYLLVRNMHRPETFGPFGGVYKYFEDAIPQLDDITFNPQIIGPGDDMKQDLRGFLPRKNLPKLLSWYRSGNNRETYNDCLCRELKEELKEVALVRTVRTPNILHFRLVRSVLEGPERVPGQAYTQFRVFEIYDLFPTDSTIKRFIKRLLKEASEHPDLLTATAQEIRIGRARDGGVIGHHCGYLISHKRIRPDTPMFVSAPALKKDELPASQTKKRLRPALVKSLSPNSLQGKSTSNGVIDDEQNKN